MTAFEAIETPAALIDHERMQANIMRMQRRMNDLGVRFRPHVKTSKCLNVAQAQIAAGAQGITVSTLKEAEQFFKAGVTDILYAVGMVPSKLSRALALCEQGCDLKLITDNVTSAREIAEFGRNHNRVFEVWIEIDTDGHRSGIAPEDDLLLDVARVLHEGGMRVGGVMTHAGSSYDYDKPEDLRRIAKQEVSLTVRAANRLREAGLPCAQVSIGSTPTALSFEDLEGVTEVRAGVYVFFDLVMHNVGVCSTDEIALSVLTTVIGHQPEKGWAIVDAGWMAMSRDRGTQKQKRDFGLGQVCSVDGQPMHGYIMSSANQEHGIVSREGTPDPDIVKTLPIGTLLRVLPNHACASAAQFPAYAVMMPDKPLQTWPRFYGW